MIGGMSGVTADVIPFSTVMGNRAKLSGINLVGLRRNMFQRDEINELRKVFKYIFFNKKNTFEARIKEIKKKKLKFYTIRKILSFHQAETRRSFIMP
jgi:Acyl-[acyl carrier protein]--UDP-N-acetylglucosamine O-acyltransferase